ncbi:DsbA family protein [Pigmentiphaga soli]|uniref:DsbA family protein n=1 Tax=Pigmentiphaga soli TaxID=1007095 RepID=A0ABP8H1M1_9BURK
MLHFYHRADDPWSHLLLQVLPTLLERYDVPLRCVTVPLPPRDYFPRPDLVARHALRDAVDLCRHCELHFETGGVPPSGEDAELASRRLLAAQDSPSHYLALARQVGEALFRGDKARLQALCGPQALPREAALRRLEANQRRQLEAGHYNSGMLAFGGTWYWGVDRLPHLEHDLLTAGRRRPDASVGVLRRRSMSLPPPQGTAGLRGQPIEIDFFCSFRSPYAYLAAERTFGLQRRYPVRIRPRLIVPMKMAGFAIPELKARYFRADPAREALRHGLRFGNFRDPFGPGLERAMALVDFAQRSGKLEPYLLSVMQGVWADGIDTATDDGLGRLAERAGLDWHEARKELGAEDWRGWAAANRAELERIGQYAAPTYRMGDWVTWGQDRIWMLEREIQARLASPSVSGALPARVCT